MSKFKNAFILLIVLTTVAFTKPQIHYTVSWDGANRHIFHVEMTIRNAKGSNLQVRMPAWRPGRYAMQNFSGNVTNFTATDASGKSLLAEKTDKDTWTIKRHGKKTIIASYDYYASQKDAGNSYVDLSEAFLNPATMLTYLPGKESLPLTIELKKPAGWKIASVLEAANTPTTFRATSFHELADTPILVSPDFNMLEFETSGVLIQLVVQGKRGYSEEDLIAETRAIVEEQFRLMDSTPFTRYMFIFHFEPNRIRHGVEHKNSTSIFAGPLNYGDGRFIRSLRSLTSHEFFHVWNVERIRPEVLWPTDYSREAYTRTMWFYEGVTEYFSNLTIHRSGLIDRDRYLQKLGSAIGRVENNPGRHISSTALTSWDSWVTFAHRPPQSSVSFYTQGEVIGALIDLKIMQQTDGKKSLTDVMRQLYQTYPVKGRGVPENGIQKAIEKISGQKWDNFFKRYIHGTDVPDYAAIFAIAGVECKSFLPLNQPQSWIGVDLREIGGALNITQVTVGSPADNVGMAIGDQLVAVNDLQVDATSFTNMLHETAPGTPVVLTFFRQGKLMEQSVVTAENPFRSYILQQDSKATERQLGVLDGWLGSE
ncbi:MAG: M61 family metallopeptidase [Calditrichia bacterium]